MQLYESINIARAQKLIHDWNKFTKNSLSWVRHSTGSVIASMTVWNSLYSMEWYLYSSGQNGGSLVKVHYSFLHVLGDGVNYEIILNHANESWPFATTIKLFKWSNLSYKLFCMISLTFYHDVFNLQCMANNWRSLLQILMFENLGFYSFFNFFFLFL